MKTNNFLYRTASILFMIFLIFSGCKKDDDNISVDPDKDVDKDKDKKEVSITFYTPVEGGESATLSLYGSNFSTDIDEIRVTVNGVDAEVISSTGNIIKVVVAKGSGSGVVKLFIGKNNDVKEFSYETEFTFSTKWKVTTFLGAPGEGKEDGSFEGAKLTKPRYLAWGKDDALYFIEEGNSSNDKYSSIRRAANNQVTTITKGSDSPLIERMRAIGFSSDYNTMYIANDANAGGSMAILTMKSEGDNYIDLEPAWEQSAITNVKVHPITGDVFVAGHYGAWIYRYEDDQFVESVQLPAIPEGTFGDRVNVNGIAFDATGEVAYFASRTKNVIYKGEYDLTTKTFSNIEILAGNYGVAGYIDGSGLETEFDEPCQIDVGEDGNLYVADRKNHCIRMVTPDGEVTTFAGNGGGLSGDVDGDLENAEFNHPEGLQFGPDGALYIADYWNHKIKKIFN